MNDACELNDAEEATQLVSYYSIDKTAVRHTEPHNVGWMGFIATLISVVVSILFVIFAKHGATVENAINRKIEHLGRGQMSANVSVWPIG